MRLTAVLTLWTLSLVQYIVCPPVVPSDDSKAPPVSDAQQLANPLEDLEYNKYIQEVVSVLDQDDEFRIRLEAANASSSEAGSVAMSLEFANKNTRTRLDELKRVELRRLQELHIRLVRQQAESIRSGRHNGKIDLEKVDMEHVDHANPHSFEVEDLKKLIKKTTEDLHKIDTQRREDFKRYEMLKEHEYREKLKHLNDTQRSLAEREHEASIKRHEQHPAINHPGNKEQLQEVWQGVDHMDKEEFEPNTFFHLHDLNGDGYLDVGELDALFQKELDKVYSPGNPDDDPVMRNEEMNRMREHYFNETDVDQDGLISRQEFLKSTESKDYQKKDEWETLEKQPSPFTDEELSHFEEQLAASEMKEKHGEHKEEAKAVHANVPAEAALQQEPKQEAKTQ